MNATRRIAVLPGKVAKEARALGVNSFRPEGGDTWTFVAPFGKVFLTGEISITLDVKRDIREGETIGTYLELFPVPVRVKRPRMCRGSRK